MVEYCVAGVDPDAICGFPIIPLFHQTSSQLNARKDFPQTSILPLFQQLPNLFIRKFAIPLMQT